MYTIMEKKKEKEEKKRKKDECKPSQCLSAPFVFFLLVQATAMPFGLGNARYG